LLARVTAETRVSFSDEISLNAMNIGDLAKLALYLVLFFRRSQ
jgi:hypothetical protein